MAQRSSDVAEKTGAAEAVAYLDDDSADDTIDEVIDLEPREIDDRTAEEVEAFMNAASKDGALEKRSDSLPGLEVDFEALAKHGATLERASTEEDTKFDPELSPLSVSQENRADSSASATNPGPQPNQAELLLARALKNMMDAKLDSFLISPPRIQFAEL